MIKVGIIGATGYTGVELLRLLAPRDDVEVTIVTSRELMGTKVCDRYANLRGHIDLEFSAPDMDKLASCDVVFYATPHAVAMNTVAELLDAGVRVIDLSADFRIKNIPLWEQWYKTEHVAPALVPDAVYGLPEINREAIKSAKLIAVPGCYPTAIQLGFLPLIENNLVECNRLIADAKSGVSGAGRKAAEDFLLCETTESIKAYGLAGHRHHPEICESLNNFSEDEIKLTFVPHLTPMIRGILATLYAPVKSGVSVDINQLQALYEKRYANEPFVDVLPQGQLPATRDVKGSNRCEIAISFSAETNTIVVLSAEDNLVKGASGQAIQNMNIMFGIDEMKGLNGISLMP